jgi:hypothetical protein
MTRPVRRTRRRELADELGLDTGVVVLRCGDLGGVEESSVECEPATVLGLDLVADGDVRVQVRVSGAAIAVCEGGRDQPAHLHLPGAASADPRVGHLALQPGEGVGDGCLVRPLYVAGYVSGRQRPERGDRLHRRESQVESGDRAGRLARGLGDESGELACVLRRSGVRIGEHPDADLGPDPCALLGTDGGVPLLLVLAVVRREGLGDADVEYGRSVVDQ